MQDVTSTKVSETGAVEQLCEHLDWDTRFFNIRIARVRSNTLTPESARLIKSWCKAHGVECLYFLADCHDAIAIRVAENEGFRLVDIRITLGHSGRTVVKQPSTSLGVRTVTADDVRLLKSAARRDFRYTRFYVDPGFPTVRVDDLYETWIENSCDGAADAVIVVDSDSPCAGYVTCHVHDKTVGQIGLLAVRGDCQERGLGRTLVEAALAWFAEREISTVRVVTQGRNRAAVRLYERCGFSIESVQIWYHRWFESQQDEREASDCGADCRRSGR
jgi:dTDP-4-amino-4,6-dideoxy-D-galactose acyltransferase